MKRKIAALILTGLFVCVFLILPMRAALGFGDFDSGSDFGGGGGSSSDSDYGSSYDSDSSGGGSGDPVVGLVMLGAFGVFLAGAAIKGHIERNRKLAYMAQQEAAAKQRQREELSEYEKFKEAHPEFSEKELFAYVRKLFTEMQTTWEAGDITPVKYGFCPDTWQRFDTQLSLKNRTGDTTHVRDIRFQSLEVTGYRSLKTEHRDKITIRIIVDYNVWVTDIKGRNIQGTPDTRHRMTYLWTMERPQDVMPEVKDLQHCPGCGAELDVAAFAECPFCHAQIRQKTQNWTIRNIQAESQQTLSK